MTEEVKKTNRASRKRVAEATPEENTQPEVTPAATRKDGRERRKMPSGATALV